jgi:hypothetical protein
MNIQLLRDGLFVNKQNQMFSGYKFKTRMTETKYKSLIIYTKCQNCKTAVLFISGGIKMNLVHYIQQFIDEIDIRDKDLFVPDNVTQFNLCLIGELTKFVKTRIVGTYDKLIIIGFSMGAVIGSHVLAKLVGINKQMICIDSPFCISEMLENISKSFSIWRPDIFSLYKYTIQLTGQEYTYKNIFDITNLAEYEQFLKTYFGFTNYRYWSTMNPLLRNCKITYLYNKLDPIVMHRENRIHRKRYRRKLDKSVKWCQYKIDYDKPGHCTEWVDDGRIIHQLRKFI